jgi:hypothetical protein
MQNNAMLSVTYKTFKLSIIMLSVIMLSVVMVTVMAPHHFYLRQSLNASAHL